MIILQRNRQYVLAAFKSPKEFGDYVSKNIDMLNSAKIVNLPDANVVYVFEDRSECNRMQLFTKEEVIQELKAFNYQKKQFNVTITVIDKIYYPELYKGKAGDDMMGVLDHSHVAKCGNCGLLAPGHNPYSLAFSSKELKETCNCDNSTW
jgi:hypothetical protein